jgi:hypothetical protein
MVVYNSPSYDEVTIKFKVGFCNLKITLKDFNMAQIPKNFVRIFTYNNTGSVLTTLYFLRNTRMGTINKCLIILGWKGLPGTSSLTY